MNKRFVIERLQVLRPVVALRAAWPRGTEAHVSGSNYGLRRAHRHVRVTASSKALRSFRSFLTPFPLIFDELNKLSFLFLGAKILLKKR